MKKLSKEDLNLNPKSVTGSKGSGQPGGPDLPYTHDPNFHDSCLQCQVSIGIDCQTKPSKCYCESFECSEQCPSDICGGESDENCGVEELTLSCGCVEPTTRDCQVVHTDGCAASRECNTNDPCNLSDAYCDQSLGEHVCESIDACIVETAQCGVESVDDCVASFDDCEIGPVD